MASTMPRPFRVSELSQKHPTPFEIAPDAPALEALAQDMGLLGLRKLRFTGEIAHEGATGWRLSGHLGATVVQPCVVTLEPVSTRIEEEVERRYIPDLPATGDLPEEMEMPEDETQEPLGATIDPGAVMAEALALALPLYPRRDSVEPEQTAFTEPGKTPMSDDDVKPFAGLAALRSKLEDGE